MSSPDPYEVLGLSPTARPEEIRHAYRQLARRFHPDVNSDPGAEERFKELAMAFSVLTDPKRRALYDEFGEASLRLGFNPDETRRSRQARRAGAAPRTARSGGARSDLIVPLEIELGLAIRGGEVRIDSPHGGGVLPLTIPAGVADGERLCLPGRGLVGRGGSRPGDLFVELRIRPNDHYRRDGLDLHLELPINLAEASRGATVEVPAPGGRLRLTVPQDCQGGERIRLRGKGLRDPLSNAAGDLVVHLCVRLPPGTAKARRALDQLERLYREPVRGKVKL